MKQRKRTRRQRKLRQKKTKNSSALSPCIKMSYGSSRWRSVMQKSKTHLTQERAIRTNWRPSKEENTLRMKRHSPKRQLKQKNERRRTATDMQDIRLVEKCALTV
ncbi:hypothetical protein BLNAU_4621 [Blattamonas nauphoetae]|uniref:Uncharacterized protein n=1 Tax=Blattamonas nauphoetae TaxID=2049346 RepID=A0ABQ9Y9M6_9EUKA|nr:hypothetical protein BLNAU_4621 [Blattamonas nauphoetae]